MNSHRVLSRTCWWLAVGVAAFVVAASTPEAAVCTPGAPELCNGLDDDCDGAVDDGASCPTTCTWPGISGSDTELQGADPDLPSSLVWNGTGYGVLTKYNQDVQFSRLDADGNLIGGPTLVVDVDYYASMVWTGTEYGVAGVQASTGVASRVAFVRLDDTGQRISPPLVLPADPIRVPTSMDLAWTGAEYGLLWVMSPGRLYFMRLDSLGVPLGPPVLLHEGPLFPMSGPPRLVWAGDGYGVLWDNPSTEFNRTYFLRLGADGSNSGMPLPIGHGTHSSSPEIVWTGTHFAISWIFSGSRFLALVDPGGAIQGPDIEIGPVELSGGPTRLSWTGSEIVALWSSYPYALMWRQIGSDGLPIGEVIRTYDHAQTHQNLGIAWNGSDFGMIWGQDSGVMFARVGCSCFDDDGDDWTVCRGDCDDSRADINPFENETCDGLDQDCDGLIDDGLHYQFSCGIGACRRTVTFCVDGVRQACVPGTPSFDSCNGIDDDCDGIVDGDTDHDGSPVCLDCNEGDAAIHQGAPEVCNGADENCNGLMDDLNGVLDGDGDGVAGACDNCPLVTNPLQEDTDVDGRADACDNCPEVANASQIDTDNDGLGNACDVCVLNGTPTPDSDSDGFGDACDNCPGLGDRTQTDSDHDGEGDVCDYSDGLPLLWAFSGDGIAWQPDGTFFFFDLYRGDLDVLRATGVYTQDPASVPLAYRVCGLDSTFWPDDSPPPGKGVFYQLVTYKGTETGFDILEIGNDSSGNPRPNTWPCDPPPFEP